MKLTIDDIKKELKNFLTVERYSHSINVCQVASELAKKYSQDISKISYGALLHDIMKNQTFDYMINIIKNSDSYIDPFYIRNKNILHGLAGSIYCEKFLGVDDIDVLNSIKYHSTGRKGMTTIEKIVFVSDSISKDRKYTNLDYIKKLAFEDLDKSCLEILIYKNNNLIKYRKELSFDSINFYNDLVL